MKRARPRTTIRCVVDAQEALLLGDVARAREHARALNVRARDEAALERELEAVWARVTPTPSGKRARARLNALRRIKRRVLAAHAALDAFCQKHAYHTQDHVLRCWKQ